jgi:hypothetical protein
MYGHTKATNNTEIANQQTATMPMILSIDGSNLKAL